jgi:sugar phosphate isomerase/epimerase
MSMRISFSTGTYYHLPLSYSLGLARDLGFDGVEWAVHPGYLLNGLDPVRRAFAEAGVRALSIHPPFYPMPGWPRRAARAAARLGALARHLDAELYVLHPPLLSSLHSARADQYADALERGKLASGPRVAIGMETAQYNLRARYPLDDVATLAAYCREHGCGITFDTCHAGANGEDVMESYAAVRPVLRNVHLSDVVWSRGSPHTHRPPGEGSLPLDAFLSALARDGYDGLVTLEIHPLHAGPFSRGRAAARLGRALEFVRKHAAAPATRPSAGPPPEPSPEPAGGGAGQPRTAEE